MKCHTTSVIVFKKKKAAKHLIGSKTFNFSQNFLKIVKSDISYLEKDITF